MGHRATSACEDHVLWPKEKICASFLLRVGLYRASPKLSQARLSTYGKILVVVIGREKGWDQLIFFDLPFLVIVPTGASLFRP